MTSSNSGSGGVLLVQRLSLISCQRQKLLLTRRRHEGIAPRDSVYRRSAHRNSAGNLPSVTVATPPRWRWSRRRRCRCRIWHHHYLTWECSNGRSNLDSHRIYRCPLLNCQLIVKGWKMEHLTSLLRRRRRRRRSSGAECSSRQILDPPKDQNLWIRKIRKRFRHKIKLDQDQETSRNLLQKPKTFRIQRYENLFEATILAGNHVFAKSQTST